MILGSSFDFHSCSFLSTSKFIEQQLKVRGKNCEGAIIEQIVIGFGRYCQASHVSRILEKVFVETNAIYCLSAAVSWCTVISV